MLIFWCVCVYVCVRSSTNGVKQNEIMKHNRFGSNGLEPFANMPTTFMLTEKMRGNQPVLFDCSTCPDEIFGKYNGMIGSKSMPFANDDNSHSFFYLFDNALR